MKILMCNSFYYLRGGAERCFFDLMHLLEVHGHEVIPFSMVDKRNWPSPYENYFIDNIDFSSQMRNGGSFGAKLRLAERVIYSRDARRKIEALIEATRPDIAHIHGIAHETSPSILPAIKKAGIPIVQTLHDYKLLCPNTNFVSRGVICEQFMGHRYYNVVRYRCKRNSLSASSLAGLEMYIHKAIKIYEDNVDLFISPSRFLQNKMMEYGVGTPVQYLPYYVKVYEFQACYEPEDYFVFSGRLVAIKGVETLLKAMQRVKASHLYVAGTGELEEHLQAYAVEQGLKNVIFLGHLNTDELSALVQRALFTIVPSEWYENYPMAVLESFACGTAVIGADIGGIPEQVRDRENGLLFESGNARELAEKIDYMLDNRGHAEAMGRMGRQQVEKFNSPDHQYQRMMEIYHSLLPVSSSDQGIPRETGHAEYIHR